MDCIEINETLPQGFTVSRDPIDELWKSNIGYPRTVHTFDELWDAPGRLATLTGPKLDCPEKVLGASYWVDRSIVMKEKRLHKQFEFLSVIPRPSMVGQYTKPLHMYYLNDKRPEVVGIPRFLGLSLFGAPKRDIRTLGDPLRSEDAEITLRPLQERCVKQTLQFLQVYGGSTIIADCGFGKCLGLNTPILMFDGSIKMVQDVNVGDTIMGDDSTPRNVLSLARGRETMFRVVPTKGDPYVVNESHILSLKHSTTHGRDIKGSIVDISVREFLNLPPTYHGPAGRLLGYRVGVTFSYRPVPIDPYLIGYWLGDGTSKRPEITTTEPEVVAYFQSMLPSVECVLTNADASGISYRIIANEARSHKPGCNTFLNALRDLDLLGNKHVPDIYKCNSRDIQLQLLAGFIDADGHCVKSCGYDVVLKDERLADDIIFMARSLGFAAYKEICQKTCTNAPGGPKTGTYYRFFIHGEGLEQVPTKLERKRCQPRKQVKDALVTRIRLERLEEDNYYGFEIDGNRRFLLGDFTVTHNTVVGLHLIQKMRRKTLIVCNREVLMLQWASQLHALLPHANLAWIQGRASLEKTVMRIETHSFLGPTQVDEYDIALCSIDTLVDNIVPRSILEHFGLMIIDECHHLAAATLMHATPLVPARYIVGLSATPDRRDGLEHVLYWLIGPTSFVYKRLPSITGVSNSVRVIKVVPKGCANKELMRYDGTPGFAEMITALTEDPRRNTIICILIDYLLALGRKKLIVVSGLVEHCHGLHLFMQAKVMSSIMAGKYQERTKALDPNTRLVFATYSLLEEGYDDPNLDTLLMVTPRSRIQQTIGRIERTAVGKLQPWVIDITDSFSVFPNMFWKRKTFYTSRGFQITECPQDLATILDLDGRGISLSDR